MQGPDRTFFAALDEAFKHANNVFASLSVFTGVKQQQEEAKRKSIIDAISNLKNDYMLLLDLLEAAIPDQGKDYTPENITSFKKFISHTFSFLKKIQELPPEIQAVLGGQKSLNALSNLAKKSEQIFANIQVGEMRKEMANPTKNESPRRSDEHPEKAKYYKRIRFEGATLQKAKEEFRKERKRMDRKTDKFFVLGFIATVLIATFPLGIFLIQKKAFKYADRYNAMQRKLSHLSDIGETISKVTGRKDTDNIQIDLSEEKLDSNLVALRDTASELKRSLGIELQEAKERRKKI